MKTNIVMVFTGLVILLLVNLSIWQKQIHLSEGEVIYLELAPVDPRSLMQGDYMALRYAISNKLQTALSGVSPPQQENLIPELWDVELPIAKDGFVVIAKDLNKVAQYVRLDNAQPVTEDQRKIQFRLRNSQIKFATNAFFFEEGDEPLYRNARYGVFRLNIQGEVLLTGLLDEQFNSLGGD